MIPRKFAGRKQQRAFCGGRLRSDFGHTMESLARRGHLRFVERNRRATALVRHYLKVVDEDQLRLRSAPPYLLGDLAQMLLQRRIV